MLWTEVRKWAKDLGYECVKDKSDGQYYWGLTKDDNIVASGTARSVSKLAKSIYNHYTDNKWLDHQTTYQENKETKKITVSDYGQ